MIRRAFLAVVLIGLALSPAAAQAQGFRLEEVTSLASVPVAQLKPKTIAFTDRAGEETDEGGGIFMRYEDWAKTRPVERQFLSLYPGYAEPNVDLIIDGTKKHYRERLHMYVAGARFVLGRAPSSLNLASFASLAFLQKIDPALKHRIVPAADLVRAKEPRAIHNQNPQRKWCEGRATSICIRSTYKLEGRLPIGVALANKLREGARKISDTLEFDSELALLPAAEADETRKLTGLDTPVAGAIEQSIFYVNEVMQFGKLLVVFQQHPSDARKTIASVYIALAIESSILGKSKQFAQMPVLRNMVPIQVLAGKSSFNSGNSLSAGLPTYARNQIKAIAALLEAQ